MPDDPTPETTAITKDVYSSYLEERQKLYEGELSAQRDYDKWLITLSGGALGLSLTFLKEVVPLDKARFLWAAATSWGLFASALVVCVFGLYLSAVAFRRFAKCLDTEAKSKFGCGPDFLTRVRKRQERDWCARWVSKLNCAGLAMFGSGVLSLAVFVAVNACTRRIEAMPNKCGNGPVVNETRGMVPPAVPVSRPATAVPLSDTGTSGGPLGSLQAGALPAVVPVDRQPSSVPANPSTPAKPDNKR